MKCIFCQNSFNKDNLIHISQNAIEYDGSIVEFSEIIEKLFQKRIRTYEKALTCERCKDLLVQFYVFYENVQSNNGDFIENENFIKGRNVNKSSDEPAKYLKIETIELKHEVLEETPNIQEVFVTPEEDIEIKVTDEDSQQEAQEAQEDESMDMTADNLIENDIVDESYNTGADQSTYACTKCNMILETYNLYIQHLSTHISSSSKRYVKLFCSRCAYQFTTQAHFTAHCNGHKLFDTLAQYMSYPKCEECNITFVDDESLELHSESHSLHPLESVGFFLKFGIRRDDLWSGEGEMKIGENSPTCGHCLKQLVNDEEMIKHLLIFHAKQLVCPIDFRNFSNNQAFTIHMRNNHPELFPNSSFVCSVCKSEFETLYDKLSHMKTCKAKNFNCGHCSKTFSRKCHLVKHLKLVSGESNITCEQCSKVCRDKHDYKIHMQSHSSEKLFKCTLCSKSYKTSSARAAHLQSHLETIPCPHCNLQFKSRRTMQKHVKNKHEKEGASKNLEEIEIY